MQQDNRAGRGPQWDRYEDLLLDAMEVLPLSTESRSSGAVYRALYQPAFHATTCVTVYDEGSQGTVELVVAPPSVRTRVMQEIGVRFGPGLQDPVPGDDLQWERAGVPAEALVRFRQALAGLVWESLSAVSADIGLDGITVRGDVGAGGTVYCFHTWSPSATRHPDAYRYCLAVLDVALASVRDISGQGALRDIYRYLSAG